MTKLLLRPAHRGHAQCPNRTSTRSAEAPLLGREEDLDRLTADGTGPMVDRVDPVPEVRGFGMFWPVPVIPEGGKQTDCVAANPEV